MASRYDEEFDPETLAREFLPPGSARRDVIRLAAMFTAVYGIGREHGEKSVRSLLPETWEPDPDEVETLINPRRPR